MSGYTLSKSAVTKTARTVKQFGTTPLSKSKQSSRIIRGGSSVGSKFTFRAKIKTYNLATGIYTVDIYENGYDNEATELDVQAIPTIYTFTPLGIGDKAIVMIDVVETLGDNIV